MATSPIPRCWPRAQGAAAHPNGLQWGFSVATGSVKAIIAATAPAECTPAATRDGGVFAGLGFTLIDPWAAA
jgi:hypothetical protein